MKTCRVAALWAIVLYAAPAPSPHFQDADGRSVQLPDEGVAVLVFTRTDCPVSNRYAPEINRLHSTYKDAGAQFWLVYVDPRQDRAVVRKHLQEFGYTMPALFDRTHSAVRAFGMRVTPEVAVLVKGQLVYRGRIDNRYAGFEKRRSTASTHDLEDVLRAAVQKRALVFRSRNAVGCFIEDLR